MRAKPQIYRMFKKIYQTFSPPIKKPAIVPVAGFFARPSHAQKWHSQNLYSFFDAKSGFFGSLVCTEIRTKIVANTNCPSDFETDHNSNTG